MLMNLLLGRDSERDARNEEYNSLAGRYWQRRYQLSYMLGSRTCQPPVPASRMGEANMTVTWVVTADSSKADFFEVDRIGGDFRPVRSLAHTEATLKGQDLTTDRPGRSFDSAGQGRHAMSSQVDPRAHEADVFAREVSETLELGRTRGNFGRLIVLAPPDFLGRLRKTISPAANKLVVETVPKSVVGLGAEEIRKRLKTLI
jgi:protein required for attachment to host cells